MNTNDTIGISEKVFFTPRHIVRKNHLGQIGMDDTFYLNDDFAGTADRTLIHCFAFGVSYWGSEWLLEKEYGRYISLNFFLEGGITVKSEKTTLRVNAGDLLIGRRTALTMWTPRGGMAKKYCLLLSNNLTQSAIFDQLTHCDPAVLTMSDPQKAASMLEHIHLLVKNGTTRAELDTAIFQFLQEVRRQQHYQPSTALLDKAMNILRQSNFKLSRAELAQECKVDPRTLTRVFTRHLNMPPGQYIIRCRLEKAVRMLTLSNEPIKNIADECGFSTAMFFAREFRQHYCCTPSEFRKKSKNSSPES